ncbi:hypothetical protein [Rhizobium rhizophilum]|uniref:Uncharacterized protein n=1 Tax=Rhizobium rhizophilum TaxID=1850373 RepID=A0ABY2R0K0_9HYPH|nr:hypothetical protein [Rhizobium rhizophilum]THV17349.1 hypothetical protein E9677_05025 [Rhizobium rhizophilum]
MTKLLRRTLLVSSTALMAITFIPVLGSVVPGPLAALVATEAQARGGDDDDSGSESDDSGRDSASDRDDSDDDSSGRDRDRSSSDDDDDDDDNRGRGRGRGGDDDNDDSDDDDDNGRRGRGGDRDEVRVIVNDNQLAGLRSGSMIPVDQNGKRLRFEFEEEHGQTEIKVRAPQGTLTGVTVIPAP